MSTRQYYCGPLYEASWKDHEFYSQLKNDESCLVNWIRIGKFEKFTVNCNIYDDRGKMCTRSPKWNVRLENVNYLEKVFL